MKSSILVHPKFDGIWPFAADHFHRLWLEQGPVEFHRLEPGDTRAGSEILDAPEEVSRLILLGVPLSGRCVEVLTGLKEVASPLEAVEPDIKHALEGRGIRIYQRTSEGFWGQSVAEFALALTLCGLRRIPQTHHEMITSHEPWNYIQPDGVGRPGERGQQFGDDIRFVNGTIAGKRVRIVGAGNIASRYGSFCHTLGAEVSAWDPFANDPCFHRAGMRRIYHLDCLAGDAQIFAPMLPLKEETEGIVTAELINALPQGTLVVLATRAGICDMATLRRRVLNDELALAADVFDIEPLPQDDPLLGRHNVVHTPHNAGRTIHANKQFAEMFADQFLPAGPELRSTR